MKGSAFPASWPKPEARPHGGRFITLTPLNPEGDAEELFASSHAPASVADLWRYLPLGPFVDVAAMREWLQAHAATPGMLSFTVSDNATDRRIGSISLMRLTPAHGVAELGWIWYAPSAQRTKANTEANFLLLRPTMPRRLSGPASPLRKAGSWRRSTRRFVLRP